MIKPLNQITGIKFAAEIHVFMIAQRNVHDEMTRIVGRLSFHPIKLNLSLIIYLFLSFLWLHSLIENILINSTNFFPVSFYLLFLRRSKTRVIGFIRIDQAIMQRSPENTWAVCIGQR